MAGVMWTGADGKLYAKGSDFDGVKDVTHIFNQEDTGWQGILNGYDTIADPNPPKQQAPATGTGGSGTTAKVLNQAAVDNTQKAIGSLDTEMGVGYKNIDDDYHSVMGKYDQERARTRGEYEEEGVSNTNDLQRNKQNALVSGAQGLRGLRGVLASIGALSGDGGALANRAVTAEANQDIGGATETASNNAQALDKAWTRFDEEDQDRRKEADTNRINNRTALEGEVAGKRQSFFQKIAELYGEAGNTGEATNWLNRAGDLNNEIAQKRARVATPFTAKAAAFTPGELENYLAGAGDMTVEVKQGAEGINGPTQVLAGRGKEDEERRRKLALV